MTRYAWIVLLPVFALLRPEQTAAAAADLPRGVDERVDQSIERGLEFLLRGQLEDGTFDSPPARRFAGIPALCGMAFLAKGYVPGPSRYGTAVEKVIDHVMASASRDGYMGGNEGRMYSHCIATLFLSEVSGMVDSNRQARLDELLPKATQVILSAQRVKKSADHQGGWRYGPGSPDSDMSCSGWALMALRSARLNGAPIPNQAIDDAVKYVLRRHNTNLGSFGYQDTQGHAINLTGAGLLCLELCGKHGDPATLRAARYLMQNYKSLPSSERRFYGMYYAAQGLFQIGGEEWQRFSEWMYDYWIPRQAPDGRWDEGEDGCPYYQTALAVLAFTVPYRQLPIYQRDETVDEEQTGN